MSSSNVRVTGSLFPIPILPIDWFTSNLFFVYSKGSLLFTSVKLWVSVLDWV